MINSNSNKTYQSFNLQNESFGQNYKNESAEHFKIGRFCESNVGFDIFNRIWIYFRRICALESNKNGHENGKIPSVGAQIGDDSHNFLIATPGDAGNYVTGYFRKSSISH